MENNKITLSAPWYAYHRKVNALFGEDPEVHIGELAEVNGEKYSYIMRVDNRKKAAAIKAILPSQISIGNCTVEAAILGPDEDEIENCNGIGPDVYNDAFSGNPIFEKIVTVQHIGGETTYGVFKKKVIQFWNDDISDYCGNYSGLASTIAFEILNPGDVKFCISNE